MIRVVQADGRAERETLAAMKARAAGENTKIAASAAQILADIRERGMEAVREYSLRFDRAEPYEVPRARLEEAYGTCDRTLIAAMEHSARNIRDYQEHLLKKSSSWEVEGGRLGQVVRGLTRVGIYVPGGTAAYPSSVLMNAVPAKVAGVEELIMVTPPTENLNDAVLAAAKIAGVDRVFAIGGVQAVAALTYGVGPFPQVDKLVGPGNAYVAAAKRLVYGTIDIDMVAGPSEVLVVADGTADPAYVAADLLSQAEHDTLASAILVTTSGQLARQVSLELERQLEKLERREIAQKSLEDYGAILVCATLAEAAQLANLVAPEHLELMVEDPEGLLPEIKNAGAVFLGAYTPEPLGDYLAGPSHVLPTSSTARFFSPLSVDSFLKKMSTIRYTREGLRALEREIDCIARMEGLTAHANSVNIRFQGEER